MLVCPGHPKLAGVDTLPQCLTQCLDTPWWFYDLEVQTCCVMSHDLSQTIPTTILHGSSKRSAGAGSHQLSGAESAHPSQLLFLMVMLRVFTQQVLADTINQGSLSPPCSSEPVVKHLPIYHCPQLLGK